MKQTTSFSKWVKVPLSMQVLMVVLTACVTLFWGCQKDIITSNPLVLEPKESGSQLKNPITTQMAQSWFESKFGKSLPISPRPAGVTYRSVDSLLDGQFCFNESYQITPIWSEAQISSYLRTQPILLVPVRPIAFLESKKFQYALVFFRDSLQNISSRLQVYRSFDNTPNVQSFNGLFYQIDLNGFVQRIYSLENGRFKSQFFLSPNNDIGRGIIATPRDECPDPSQCASFGGGFKGWLRHVFGGIGGGSSSGGSGIINVNVGTDGSWLGLGNINWTSEPSDNNGGNGNGGGSSGGNLFSEIDQTLFDVAGQTTVQAYYQGIYMNAPMNFSDTEFEDLYFDRRIFTVVEHFFQQKGRSPGNVAIIRFMMSNPNFKNYYTQIKEVLESGNPIYIPEGGNTMSVNPINYLKCFEPRPNSTYKVSICVEQPIENSREVNRGDNCGHTFLILEQSFDGETIRRSLGFYPSSEWTTVFGSPNQEAMYANNQLHTYHVSISGDLTESNFMAIIEKIRVYYNNQYHYDLYSFNCSTFALNVTQGHLGYDIPRTEVSMNFGRGAGVSPSNLAEDIRAINIYSNTPNVTKDVSASKKVAQSNSNAPSSGCN